MQVNAGQEFFNGRNSLRREMVFMKMADQWSGVFLFILAALIFWASASLPYGSIRNPGSGFYPLWLGVILGGMAIGLILQTTWQKEGARVLRDILMEKIRWGKILLVLISLILYAFLLDTVGFLFLTFLLLAFLLRAIETQSWKVVIGWAVLGASASYLVFEVWMKLRLPRGILGI